MGGMHGTPLHPIQLHTPSTYRHQSGKESIVWRMTRLRPHEHPQIQSSTPCESEERDRLKTSNRRIMHNRQQRHIQPPSRDCEQCCCSTHHPNCGDRARSSPSPIHTHTPSPNIDRVRFCICVDSTQIDPRVSTRRTLLHCKSNRSTAIRFIPTTPSNITIDTHRNKSHSEFRRSNRQPHILIEVRACPNTHQPTSCSCCGKTIHKR